MFKPKCYSLLICIFLFVPIQSASSLSFNFPTFGTQPAPCQRGRKTICLEGDAHLSEGMLQLTVNDGFFQSSLGRAYYSEPIRLWDKSANNLASFTTSFYLTIQPSNNSGGMADGIAFFLAPYPYVPPSSFGGFLGLVSDANRYNTSGLVAVEFDTYPNIGEPFNWDPSFQHVGIDINSIKSVQTTKLYPAGRVGDVRGMATVSYDAGTKKLSVRFVDNVDRSRVISLSYTVDLKKVLPEWVAVGLSGSTGDWFQFNKISSWEFSSTLGGIY